MNVELLISTMNLNDPEEQIKQERVSGKSLIINQITKTGKNDIRIEEGDHRCFSFHEKGLSRSRNRALNNAIGDICTLSDDDMTYCENYEEIILSAYKKYPEADLIAFSFLYPDGKEKHHLREGRVSLLMSMKINSAMITYKRKSVIENRLMFDERFGAGGLYPWGEENIFLFDCIRKGLKLYYVPIIIGQLQPSNSSWSRKNTPKHFEQMGAIYYRMSSRLFPFLIIQFALRKRSQYIEETDMFTAIKSMFIGAKKFKRKDL